MKKFLFIASALAIVAGCAKVTTVNTEEPQEIAFKAYTNVTTKAPITDAKFPEWPMLVHAFFDGVPADGNDAHYFGAEGVKFAKEQQGNYWIANDGNTYYWPVAGNLIFNAVAPYDYTNNVVSWTNVEFIQDGTNYALSSITAKLEDNSGYQTDVLVSKTVTSSKRSDGVPMGFQHALAQVVVNAALAADLDGYLIEIREIRIAGTTQSGEVTAKPTADDVTFDWDNLGKDKEMTVYSGTAKKLGTDPLKFDGTVAGSKAILVVPEELGTAQQLLLTYNVQFPDQPTTEGLIAAISLKVDEKTESTEDEGDCLKWEAGKKYIYNLTFTGPQEIKIAPEVKGWEDQTVNVPGI